MDILLAVFVAGCRRKYRETRQRNRLENPAYRGAVCRDRRLLRQHRKQPKSASHPARHRDASHRADRHKYLYVSLAHHAFGA